MRNIIIKLALSVLRWMKASQIDINLYTGFWYRGNEYHAVHFTEEIGQGRRKLTIESMGAVKHE